MPARGGRLDPQSGATVADARVAGRRFDDGRAGQGRARCACAVRFGGAAGGRCGEGSGLPEQQDPLQAAEDAREDRCDQGVYGRRAPGTILPRLRRVAQAGDLVAEGG